MLYFSKIGKGDQKGDHLKICIGLKFENFLENFKTKLLFQTKIELQVVPLCVPTSLFEKYSISAFTAKNVIAK